MAPSAPKKENIEVDRVKILVGNTKVYTYFYVPRSKLHTSRGLCNILESDKGVDRSVVAVGVGWEGPKVFPCYEHWLHSRAIVSRAGLNEVSGENIRDWFYDLLICWCLGHLLQDELYQDMVMSTIIDEFKKKDTGRKKDLVYVLTSANVEEFYDRAEAGTPLRLLLADVIVYFLPAGEFNHLREDRKYPRTFIEDVMARLAIRRDRQVSKLEAQQDQPSRQPPPPSQRPTTPTLPWLVTGDAVQLRSPMRSNSQQKGSKQVKFEDDGNFAPDECFYHMHQERNQPCWR